MSSVTLTFAETTMDQSVEVRSYGLDDGGVFDSRKGQSLQITCGTHPPSFSWTLGSLHGGCMRLEHEADHLSIAPKLRMGGTISFLPPCAFMSRKATTLLVA